MENDELKEYIDDVKKDNASLLDRAVTTVNDQVEKLEKCVNQMKSEFKTKVEELRTMHFQCPLGKRIGECETEVQNIKNSIRTEIRLMESQLEVKISEGHTALKEDIGKIGGKVFRSDVLVYIFMAGLLGLAGLHLYSIQPKDVYVKLEALEKIVLEEIVRETEEDKLELKKGGD
ncbi:unnamed protein product [marine sediment metagenome]|uniref:Uncharacterized protein n=1 Tax=marine sediment metagenome TaxID=412755 RepID=X0XWQ0_9ZZZZ